MDDFIGATRCSPPTPFVLISLPSCLTVLFFFSYMLPHLYIYIYVLFLHVPPPLFPVLFLLSWSITVLQKHAQAGRSVQQWGPPGDTRGPLQFTGCQVKWRLSESCLLYKKCLYVIFFKYFWPIRRASDRVQEKECSPVYGYSWNS